MLMVPFVPIQYTVIIFGTNRFSDISKEFIIAKHFPMLLHC